MHGFIRWLPCQERCFPLNISQNSILKKQWNPAAHRSTLCSLHLWIFQYSFFKRCLEVSVLSGLSPSHIHVTGRRRQRHQHCTTDSLLCVPSFLSQSNGKNSKPKKKLTWTQLKIGTLKNLDCIKNVTYYCILAQYWVFQHCMKAEILCTIHKCSSLKFKINYQKTQSMGNFYIM